MPRRQPERMRPRVPAQERGFALLLVFALAASVAILIYLEIPRVAFERQRDKEALLIDRGEQYSRAIELYARKNGRYPQTLDDLEHAQTIRFLRRRYPDPMTGKDEWRLVHINAAGQYTDSKVHNAGALNQQDSGPSVLASRIQGVGQSASIVSQDSQVSAALQKRASDRISPGTPGSGAGSGSGDPSQAGVAGGNPDPNQQPDSSATPGQTPAQLPGGPATNQQNTGGAQPGANPNPQNPNSSGGLAGTPTFGSILPNANTNPSTQPDASGGASNLSGTMQQPQAMQAIQSMLGANRNAPSLGVGQPGTPSALGAGLVGVATTVEMEGIRRYKEHSNYSEWEFIYDPLEAQKKAQGAAAQPGAGTPQSPGSGAANSTFGGMPGGPAAPPPGRFN